MKIFYNNLSILSFKELLFYAFCSLFNKNSESYKKLNSLIYLSNIFIKKQYNLQANFLSNTFLIKRESLELKIRKNSSDLEVAKQIFLEHEYEKPSKKIKDLINISNSPVILDAGANIGCSPLYFASFFTNSKVIALEPFPDTFSILKNNLIVNNPEILSLKAALWSRKSSIDFDFTFRDGKEWSIKTLENPKGKIKAIGLMDIEKTYKIKEIDILKVDIEGSEFEVFLNSETNCSMLPNIKSIVMEIHDDAGSRIELYEKLKAFRFDIIEMGELTLFLNKNFLK